MTEPERGADRLAAQWGANLRTKRKKVWLALLCSLCSHVRNLRPGAAYRRVGASLLPPPAGILGTTDDYEWMHPMMTTKSRAPRTAVTVPVSVRMPQELKEKLQELASADDRTLNWYVQRVLAEHVENIAAAEREAD